MALPLKSGADLYNQQLIRAAIWNHGADPSETVTGLMYFNTSNSNVGKKLRVHNGSGWKTLAFEEDLDVANNAEFKALEDKVKLLSGEVDTDAIINNMKDVENFLAGFNESGGTLMNYLNTELGKKFDKLGGTISGTLKVSSSGSSVPFTVEAAKSAYVAMIMRTNAGQNGHFIYAGDSTWRVSDAGWNNAYNLIHEGNVGNYNAGSATKLETPRTIWGQSFDGTRDVRGSLYGGVKDFTIYGYDGSDHYNVVNADSNNKNLWIGYGSAPRSYNCNIAGNNVYLRYGTAKNFGLILNSSGNVTIGSSDLAGTSKKLYVSGEAAFALDVYIANGKSLLLAEDAEGIGIGGGSVFWHNAANIWTKALMVFKENGNVLIGTSKDNGQKLQVDGDIVASGTIACKGIAAEGSEVGMGTVDKTVLYITPNNTQQTFTLNHGLGTREIAISIYEITSMGTNMILTDVEIVDDNNISVSFGNPPSENHMVVVMG